MRLRRRKHRHLWRLITSADICLGKYVQAVCDCGAESSVRFGWLRDGMFFDAHGENIADPIHEDDAMARLVWGDWALRRVGEGT